MTLCEWLETIRALAYAFNGYDYGQCMKRVAMFFSDHSNGVFGRCQRKPDCPCLKLSGGRWMNFGEDEMSESCGNCRFWKRHAELLVSVGAIRQSTKTKIVIASFRGLEFQWCGGGVQNHFRYDVKLYQLPNGQHIYPDDVRVLAMMKGGYSSDARRQVCSKSRSIFCATMACIIPYDTKKPPKPCATRSRLMSIRWFGVPT